MNQRYRRLDKLDQLLLGEAVMGNGQPVPRHHTMAELVARCACPKTRDGDLNPACTIEALSAGALLVRMKDESAYCRQRAPFGDVWVCRDSARKELYRRFGV